MPAMIKNYNELEVEQLRRVCDPAQFKFKTTADLPELTEIIGQERAVRTTSFGIDIESPGYHIFALGPGGTGKTAMIKDLLERKSADQLAPDDWCYVKNFDDSDKPFVLRLAAGKGSKLQADMDHFVEDLGNQIHSAFAAKDYEKEREKIVTKIQEKHQSLIKELEKATASKDFALLQTPRGLVLAPITNDNVLAPDQFSSLSEKERAGIEKRQNELQEELRDTIRGIQEIQEEAKEEIHQLDQEVVGYAVEHLINRIIRKYADLEPVVKFLQNVRTDILKNV